MGRKGSYRGRVNVSLERKDELRETDRRRYLRRRLEKWNAEGRRGRIPYVKKWFPGIEQLYAFYDITGEDVFIPTNPSLIPNGVSTSEPSARRRFKYIRDKTVQQSRTTTLSDIMKETFGES